MGGSKEGREWEPACAEPSEEGVGRTGKEESRGKGASRREGGRENQSGSCKEKEEKEEERERSGGLRGKERESTQTAALIQDHWQLYFKGNSQNCDTALHNC